LEKGRLRIQVVMYEWMTFAVLKGHLPAAVLAESTTTRRL
jgi:hypothetical protein